MTRRVPVPPLFAAALLIGGCADVRESLGLALGSPDEFKVVSRAPLEMPESLDRLPEVRPGELRSQEVRPEVRAQTALFGGALPDGRPGGGEETLIAAAVDRALMTTGHLAIEPGVAVRPDIRARIDEERLRILDDATWLERINPIVDYGDPTEVAVDVDKERRRLQTNAALGLPANEGDFGGSTAPREEKALLEDLF